MTKSEVKTLVAYLVPLTITYIGTTIDEPYIVIAGSLSILGLAIKSLIQCNKGEEIETPKTDNINNTSYTFYIR
jgi:hypothetical protein